MGELAKRTFSGVENPKRAVIDMSTADISVSGDSIVIDTGLDRITSIAGGYKDNGTSLSTSLFWSVGNSKWLTGYSGSYGLYNVTVSGGIISLVSASSRLSVFQHGFLIAENDSTATAL